MHGSSFRRLKSPTIATSALEWARVILLMQLFGDRATISIKQFFLWPSIGTIFTTYDINYVTMIFAALGV